MMSNLLRVLYGSLAVVAGLLLLRDPPPTWVVWMLLVIVGISGYRRHRNVDGPPSSTVR